MALSKIDAANFLTGTIPSGNIATSSLAAAATGKILQVQQVTSTSNQTVSATSYTAITFFSVAITPSATSSKILISCTTGVRNGTADKSNYLTIYRDSTNLGTGATGSLAFIYPGAEDDIWFNAHVSLLDSPSTTSEVTYQLYSKTDSSGACLVNGNAQLGNITAIEVAG
jgi:uncharacterized cupredoxin-like copper-binding protein